MTGVGVHRSLGRGSLPELSWRATASTSVLNIGHFLSITLLTLVFATVAALALSREWSLWLRRPADLRHAGLRRLRPVSLPAAGSPTSGAARA